MVLYFVQMRFSVSIRRTSIHLFVASPREVGDGAVSFVSSHLVWCVRLQNLSHVLPNCVGHVLPYLHKILLSKPSLICKRMIYDTFSSPIFETLSSLRLSRVNSLSRRHSRGVRFSIGSIGPGEKTNIDTSIFRSAS